MNPDETMEPRLMVNKMAPIYLIVTNELRHSESQATNINNATYPSYYNRRIVQTMLCSYLDDLDLKVHRRVRFQVHHRLNRTNESLISMVNCEITTLSYLFLNWIHLDGDIQKILITCFWIWLWRLCTRLSFFSRLWLRI